MLNTGVRVPLRGTGEETDFPGRPRVSVSHLITCIKFSLIVLKIKLHTKKKTQNSKNVHFMPSETVPFFPNKIQELWSELRWEFTAEQSCF